MKKEDLKSTLGKIKPREELVNSTLVKMKEQREKEWRRETRVTPVYARSLRVAGAFCAFAIVFCLGFFAARQSDALVTEPDSPEIRLSGELDTDNVSNPGINIASYGLDEETEWIIVNGRIDSMQFGALDEQDEADGVVSRAIVSVSVSDVVNRSEELSRDKINTEIEADVLFYDTESLNAFVNSMSGELLIKLVPVAENGWEIADFSPVE
ncbi:MAG: hypothetical protein IJY39_01025 [Clostridia bacterium]|nr:hypothetical protein [Clostridia bacterium]